MWWRCHPGFLRGAKNESSIFFNKNKRLTLDGQFSLDLSDSVLSDLRGATYQNAAAQTGRRSKEVKKKGHAKSVPDKSRA